MVGYLFILLCSFFLLLKADVSSLSYSEIAAYNLSFYGDGYLYQFPPECSKVLDEFALNSSNFTLCSLKNARPIRLCTKCVEEYMHFQQKYAELITTTVNGTSCRSIFISHDRLDVILEYHNNILSVWDKGNCNDCFYWTDKAPELSNNTKRFNTMYNNTMDCIINHLRPNNNNSEEVCEKCMQSYLQLDEFYKSLSEDSIGVDSICMDVVDSMNATRSIWSKNLNCCKLRKSPEIIFLCCTAIISFLPLLYYLAMRYCGPIRDLPNVLKQSRFKQTILRSIDGGIN